MRSCSKRHVLVLLGLLLTAAASGDDFCLPLQIFPSLSPGGEGQAFDDPNEDFLEATDSELVRSLESCIHDITGAADFGPATPSTTDTASRQALLVTAAATQRPPRTEPNLPLRC